MNTKENLLSFLSFVSIYNPNWDVVFDYQAIGILHYIIKNIGDKEKIAMIAENTITTFPKNQSKILPELLQLVENYEKYLNLANNVITVRTWKLPQ